jgi:2-C-methyl-D-erythritol 4-phosphate cytidylyltransferase
LETWAVVVAAGDGRRFGAAKQFVELAGRRVVDWSLDVAREVCGGVVLVVPDGVPEAAMFEGSVDRVVAGGATRSDSVRRGLAAVPAKARLILVHDAARPLSSVALWLEVIKALEAGADAAIPAVALSDTVKQVVGAGRLVTLDRSKLVAVQTPQGFRAKVLRRVHATEAQATDDAALVEASGGRVTLVEGSPDNLKITSPSDLVAAQALLAARRAGTLLG